jgi:hypothetical protein
VTTHEIMPADGFAAVLDFLELDDESASVAFGVEPAAVTTERSSATPIPFLVSLATVLMRESPRATQLAFEHGLPMRLCEPSLAEVLAAATGVGVMLEGRPALRLVRSDPDERSLS